MKSTTVLLLEKLSGGPLTLSKVIEAIRVGEEQSQQVFAARLGISPCQLNDIERGRESVSPESAKCYAQVLGHSEEQFVKLASEGVVKDD